MAPRNQGMSKFFSDVKQWFLHFATTYSIAVKSGANVAGKQIMEAMEQLNQPADIPAGKLFAAVKIGVQHASEHMVNAGITFVEQMKNGQKSSKK
ncbi:hypothetical protein A8709_00090 [Paenibacillus pectinilyticus]|uniref:Uncharacterized protein n=1 Tax=Paenibacillus pectinilyticus TaxID=512399 RepID=A0A1C1A0X9_9BACL|nr:hypothetical protein [Paenibacillus pectinilyticus]OCT13978.1 hypothetical protein A8709_00090 [Paenibacillus pectinilyticus]